MFNVDTRTTITFARIHQAEIAASFPRKRRTFRRDAGRPVREAPAVAYAPASPVGSTFGAQPEAAGA